MAGRATIDFHELRQIVAMYDRRARAVFNEVAPAAADAMHAEVLEVFDTEGYGQWPRFAWQRRGEPPPGTPMGTRAGPLTPKQDAARAKRDARDAKRKATEKAERKRQKKLRASFGHALGSVERRYGASRGGAAPKKEKRKRSAKTARYYRRMQGNPKLLQDTGNLVGSVTPYHENDLVEVFTNVPYAKYHISPAPRRVIPLRDFFAIDMAAFEADVVSMILNRIERASAAE